MKITVLGNNGPYPGPGGACSGYLLENKDTKILIDCGNGVLSRLQKFCSVSELDAIILTHLHSDHVSDIFVMKYALGINKTLNSDYKPIPVYTPKDDEYLIDNMNYNNAFEINSISENIQLQIGDMKIEFIRTKHPVETYGIKAIADNRQFIYSADTGYFEELVDFIKDSDLFLCEAGILSQHKNDNILHLTPEEGVELAERANIKKLLITHIYPEYNLESILKEAVDSRKNVNVELSKEMNTYYI